MKKTTPVLVVVVSALSMAGAFLANTFDVGAQSAAGQMPRDRKPAPSVGAAQDSEEARLQRALTADPSNVEALRALGALYNRTGRFELAVQSFERVATLRPADPEAHHVVGTYYFEKTRDQTLTPETKQAYIERGLAAEDEALAINPEYMEALVYKNLLLRVQAVSEPDPVRKQALVSQADALRNKALQLQKNRSTGAVPAGAVINIGSAPPPPPPPPPPGGVAGDIQWVYADTEYTAAGSRPVKIKDVRPIYAPMVIASGIKGDVVLEATVDTRGKVATVRVVQTLPMLTQATVDAVRQWEFDPASIGSEPAVITITASFKPPKGH
jgi:TonB family protein